MYIIFFVYTKKKRNINTQKYGKTQTKQNKDYFFHSSLYSTNRYSHNLSPPLTTLSVSSFLLSPAVYAPTTIYLCLECVPLFISFTAQLLYLSHFLKNEENKFHKRNKPDNVSLLLFIFCPSEKELAIYSELATHTLH